MIARNSNSPLPLAQTMIIGPQTDIVNGGGFWKFLKSLRLVYLYLIAY